MQGLYFLVSLIAVAVVVAWAIAADRAGPDGVYRGLLGIKRPEETALKPAKTQRWRPSRPAFARRQ